MIRVQGSLTLAGPPATAVAHLDEDEATLAVAAGHEALRSGATPPEQVRRLEVVADALPSWAPHVKIALGLRNAEMAHVTEGVVARGTLRIRGDAGRSGGSPRDAFAEATLGGSEARRAVTASQRTVDPGFVQRLLDAETRCLRQVPMGANVPRPTWDASLEARYRLLVSTCDSCRASHHPALDPCPRCGQATRVRSHDEGTIHTFTTIAKGGGPTEFDEWQALDGDYGVAVVELAPGIRVAGMMVPTDLARLQIGQRVRAVFRRLYAQDGAWRYGVKFAPSDVR